MKNHVIDNSTDLRPCILWQYDKAVNLIALVTGFQRLVNSCTGDFWEVWRDSVLRLESCDSFGLALVGKLFGATRPRQATGDSFYRRLVHAKISLLNHAVDNPIVIGALPWNASTSYAAGDVVTYAGAFYVCRVTSGRSGADTRPDTEYGAALWRKARQTIRRHGTSVTAINEYLRVLFRTDAATGDNNVVVLDNGDMSIDYLVKHPGNLTAEENAVIGTLRRTRRCDSAGNVLIENDAYPQWKSGVAYAVSAPVQALSGSVWKNYRSLSSHTSSSENSPTSAASASYWAEESRWFRYVGNDATLKREMSFATPDAGKDLLVISDENENHRLVFPYPTGVRKNSVETIATPIGLNESKTIGQNLENFALASDQGSGGAFKPKATT